MYFMPFLSCISIIFFFFSSRRRHTRLVSDWSSDVCSSDLTHDLTVMVNNYMVQMPGGHFWTVTDALHQRMFEGNIHGGTLVYRRSMWLAGIRYPEANLAEDAALIRRATQSHYRLLRLANDGIFVYLRHYNNAWKFDSGQFLDPQGWSPTIAPSGFSTELLDAYRAACSG